MGRAYTSRGPLNLRNARHADDAAPLDPACTCLACRNHARAYIHHLLKCDEMLGPILLTTHNIHYYQALMGRMRAAILDRRFEAEAARIEADWNATE
jgi:queuine tRNA-ribosyltransferase